MKRSQYRTSAPVRSLRGPWLVLGMLLVLAGGCASTSNDGDDGPRRDRNRISFEELQAAPPGDLLSTVRRLRNRWITSRTRAQPSVHVDGRFSGGLEVLQTIRVADAQELLFRSATEATTLYGTNYPAGVIEVTTRR